MAEPQVVRLSGWWMVRRTKSQYIYTKWQEEKTQAKSGVSGRFQGYDGRIPKSVSSRHQGDSGE
jgi:hypothetical protein